MAKSPNRRDVVPNPNGGWDITKPGGERASAHYDRQSDAISRSRTILHNAGGGEQVIHNREGRIRDKNTIAPGNDPCPPRDKR